MKKHYTFVKAPCFVSLYRKLLLPVLLFCSIGLTAQVTVTSTTGTAAPSASYGTVAAAITAINGGVLHTGTISCLVNAGYTETTPVGGFSITATGTALNPITFMKNGAGANPVFTAPNPQATGFINDAIFKIIGGDFITIDGFTLQENAANATTAAASNNMTEFGIALFYSGATNGVQNCTIKNCSISLKRAYQNTFGIYSNSTHTATAVSSSVTATGANGGNHNLTLTGNAVSNVNVGIVVVGPTASGDENDGLTIGGTASNANAITNYGNTGTFSSYANVSGTVNGILVRNTKNFNVSYNTITSPAGNVTAGTLRGIGIITASNPPTGTIVNNINHNSISVTSGVSAVNTAIDSGVGTGNITTTLNINNNDIYDSGYSIASNAIFTAIQQLAVVGMLNINNNTFTNLAINTTSTVYGINNQGATANFMVDGNSVVGSFSKTAPGQVLNGYFNFAQTTTAGTGTISNNNFSNLSVVGATALYGIRQYSSNAQIENIVNNTLNNLSGGTGAVSAISHGFGAQGSVISGNTVSNITSTGQIFGIRMGDVGLTGYADCFNNTLSGFSTTGTVIYGIFHPGGVVLNIYKNKIYNLEANNTSGVVHGIYVTAAGSAADISTNLIGDLRAPITNLANALYGINLINAATATVYYNTVLLNGTSSGATFGSSAVAVAATVGSAALRNNIFINNSAANGAGGRAAAYRRGNTVLTSYDAASNNNIFYGSTIFFDGTNTDATLAAYKTRVSPRDAASFSENTTFLSTSGASANFLHINPAVATAAESGAVTIATYTTDFDGDTRAATPDIGADEGTFTISASVTPCSLTTTWSGSSWSPFLPAATQNAVLGGNYASSGDLSACSLTVNNNAVVTVNSGHDFNIKGAVTVSSGSLTFENNANLIQVDNVSNTGAITVKRNAVMRRLDYVYWGSPVASQDLKLFSPYTVSPTNAPGYPTPTGVSRFFTMNETNNSFQVITEPLGVSFDLARGYMLRAPNNFPTNGSQATFLGVYAGTPNNGNATIGITNTPVTGKGYNMLGNPYPSTLSADLFLAQNPGELYFWSHTNQDAATGANYATYTTFGTAAAAGGATPDGSIAVGQGFLLKTAASGTATFLNSMRTGNNNATFFRNANIEKHRIWLNLSNATGFQNQILVGYMDGATQGADISVDGKQIEGNINNIASLIGDEKFNIQGRALPFMDTDEIPLAFNALAAGSFTIAIDHLDGLFAEGQLVFIKDNVSGIIHNLTESGYTFAAGAGTTTNRFSVVFQNTTLGIPNPVFDANNVIVYKADNLLNINSGDAMMSGVKIFDIRGRLIYERQNINATTAVLRGLRADSQILVVQVTSADHVVITKKVAY